MKQYKWFTPIEVFFLFLVILMTALLIYNILLIVYNFPMPHTLLVVNLVIIFVTIFSVFGFLIISWSLKQRRARDAVLLEHTIKIVELEHRLAALNSTPKTVEKANVP
ncbi:hypothetical protein N826_07625 [Skermanella aerolata KACC 11604]|nr:hypothetical protein N826_07625 [Skermanella aerolata KACC 11604]